MARSGGRRSTRSSKLKYELNSFPLVNSISPINRTVFASILVASAKALVRACLKSSSYSSLRYELPRTQCLLQSHFRLSSLLSLSPTLYFRTGLAIRNIKCSTFRSMFLASSSYPFFERSHSIRSILHSLHLMVTPPAPCG